MSLKMPMLSRLSAPDHRTDVGPTPANQDGHIRALDALRGVAILLVLVFHFTSYGHGLPPGTIAADRVFQAITRAGWVGVDLFFVLSGFLITGVLYDSKSRGHYFRNFYARRVLRIFPVYYVALLVFLVAVPILLPHDESLRAIRRDGVWYWTYLSNVMIARYGWPEHGALGHFWSLAVEEQFYLLWPVVVLLLNRSRLMQICVVCIAGSLAIRVGLVWAGYQTAAFVLTPARLDALSVGALLALIARGPSGLTVVARRARPIAASLALLLLGILVWRGFESYDLVVSTIGHTLLAGLFGAVLVMAVTAPPRSITGRLFASGLLCFFGRYSYALYVFHHPLLFFGPGLVPLDWVPTVFGSLVLKQLVFVAAATAVSVAIALVSWHGYEKRFLALKRYFAAHSRRADARPAERALAGAGLPSPVTYSSEPRL